MKLNNNDIFNIINILQWGINNSISNILQEVYHISPFIYDENTLKNITKIDLNYNNLNFKNKLKINIEYNNIQKIQKNSNNTSNNTLNNIENIQNDEEDIDTSITYHNFKEIRFYTPYIYERIRCFCNIFLFEYFNKIVNIKSNKYYILGSPGKSGSWLAMNPTKEYIIKSIPKNEAQQLKKDIKSYYIYLYNNYMNNENKLKTFLPIYFGLYKIIYYKNNQLINQYLLIIPSLLPSKLSLYNDQRLLLFDLKGSHVSRKQKHDEKILKDIDYENRNISNDVILPNDIRNIILQRIENDVRWLMDCNIMDYSLLLMIGIREDENNNNEIKNDNDDENNNNLNNDYNIFMNYRYICDECLDTKFVYYFGIIDTLCPYVTKKKAARFFKMLKGDKGSELSTINPQKYGQRFLEYINNTVFREKNMILNEKKLKLNNKIKNDSEIINNINDVNNDIDKEEGKEEQNKDQEDEEEEQDKDN